MRIISYITWFTLIAVVSFSCNKFSAKEGNHVVAECLGNYLYAGDLEGIVLPGTSSDDSIAITRQYIDNWIMQQILLHQAESNLTNEQKDFKEQLESYRNSLIIYEYERVLIRQKLDTIVTDEQIESFYNENKQNFLLQENIVRVNYVKIPVSSSGTDLIPKATRYLKSDKEGDLDKLNLLCDKSMLICFTDDESWIRFDDLKKEIPIETSDEENFLTGRTFYEFSDSLFTYLIRFKEIKTKEALSPLQLEKENIKNMILNTRRIELIDKMQQTVFQEALAKKEFTIY